jgi:hypothetical protein
MPVSNKSATCELSHVFTPSINYSLLLKHCDPNQFFQVGKTGGNRSEWDQGCKKSNNSQLKCSSSAWVGAAVCRYALSQNTTLDTSIPHLLFWMVLCSFFNVSQYTSDIIVVPCCMNSTISSPFQSQKTVTISFLAGRRLFKLFRLVWWMCVHPLLWLLFGFSISKWNPGFITCYSYNVIEKFAIFVVSLKKIYKSRSVLCAPVSISGTHLAQNLW